MATSIYSEAVNERVSKKLLSQEFRQNRKILFTAECVVPTLLV